MLSKPGGVQPDEERGRGMDGGQEREEEVGLITVPSVFVLRRIKQPYLPAIP